MNATRVAVVVPARGADDPVRRNHTTRPVRHTVSSQLGS